MNFFVGNEFQGKALRVYKVSCELQLFSEVHVGTTDYKSEGGIKYHRAILILFVLQRMSIS